MNNQNKAANQPQVKQCKYCKQMIDKKASVCPFCRKKQSSSGCLIVILLFFFAIILFPSFIGYSKRSGSSNSSSSSDSALSPDAYKKLCSVYVCKDVERNPDDYVGKYMKVTGKVLQSQNDIYRVKDSDGSTWYITYKIKDGESRILEDDTVTFYGECNGLKTYTALLGQEVTIPELKAEYAEISQETTESQS